MSQFTPGIQLPLVEPGLGIHVSYNEAILAVDLAVSGSAEAYQDDAPTTPTENTFYVVKSPTSGNTWEGHSNDIAIYVNGAWRYITPGTGARVMVKDSGKNVLMYYNGTSWLYGAGNGRAWLAAYKSSGGQSFSTSYAKLLCQTKTIDHDKAYEFPHGGTDYGRIEIQDGGTYLMQVEATVLDGGSGPQTCSLGIGYNSSSTPTTGSVRAVDIGRNETGFVSTSMVIDASANDDFYPLIKSSSGSMTAVDDQCAFTVQRINP